MIEVTRREFQLHPYKYLQEGQFVVTNRGTKEFVVTIQPYSKEFKLEKRRADVFGMDKHDLPTEPETMQKESETMQKKEVDKPYVQKYACGCKMGDTRLCPKHHRS